MLSSDHLLILQARNNFDVYFENCKNHIRGIISSYENLLETINYRKRQEKLTKQCARLEKLGAVEGEEWASGRKKGYFGEEDDEEEGYGIDNKNELADEDEVDDGFNLFGLGAL